MQKSYAEDVRTYVEDVRRGRTQESYVKSHEETSYEEMSYEENWHEEKSCEETAGGALPRPGLTRRPGAQLVRGARPTRQSWR